jgi:hypothetical protein
MDAAIENLARIVQGVEDAPNPDSLDVDSMMKHYMDVMGWSLYLLRLSVALDPSKGKNAGFKREDAVLVGLMVRVVKLYEAFYQNVAKRQLEVCGILLRTLNETEYKLQYLILRTREGHGVGNFFIASYKPEKQMLDYLSQLNEERELEPIETRMLRSIERELSEEGISIEDLLANKNWNQDGKNVRDILKYLDADHLYPFAYGAPSCWVHGGWGELRRYHLNKEKDGRYTPRLDFGDPDPRFAGPVTITCLELAKDFIAWAHGGKEAAVTYVIDQVMQHVFALEQSHEATL